MRTSFRSKTIAMLTVVGTLFCTLLNAQTHPRLLFGPQDVAGLRARASQEPYKSMLAEIEKQTTVASDWIPDYYSDWRGMHCAFMYVLTGDASWATKARAHVDSVFALNQWAANVKGLRLFMHGTAVSLMYDWCYSGWDATYRSQVSAKLKAQGDYIITSGGSEQNTNNASNWQFGRGASAGLCYLATDESYDAAKLDDAYAKVVTYFRQNASDNPLSRGWSMEGLGYQFFATGTLAGPFGIAMSRAFPQRDIRNEMASVRRWWWAPYAPLCNIRGSDNGNAPAYGMNPVVPAFTDASNLALGEGMYGQAFWYCADELKPGLKYWYDKVFGMEGSRGFDKTRAGAIYSYLFYPTVLVAKDPMTIPQWLEGFNDAGGNGIFTFRNQYKDSTDIVAQFKAELRAEPNGNGLHWGSDLLTFNIYGLNSLFATGAGKGNTHITANLYPEDPAVLLDRSRQTGSLVGTPQILANGGGFVIARAAKNEVGTVNQKRWFVADYSKKSGTDALFVIGDQSNNGKFWRMGFCGAHDITVSGNTFTITGADGASMRGTVLYPNDVTITTGAERFQALVRYHNQEWYGNGSDRINKYVSFKGNGDYLVALTLARAGQTHPVVTRTNGVVVNAVVAAAQARISLLEQTVRFDATAPSAGVVPKTPSLRSVTAAKDFSEIALSWQDNDNSELGYNVYRSLDGTNFEPAFRISQANQTQATDFGLKVSTTYYYRVTAYSDAGESAPSEIKSATTIAATATELLAFDSFEEAKPGPLSTQVTGKGWTTPWNVNASRIIYVGDNPLKANGVHGGNYAIVPGYGGATGGIRTFANAWDWRRKPFWISFLLRVKTGVERVAEVGIFNGHVIANGAFTWNWQNIRYGNADKNKPIDWGIATKYTDGVSTPDTIHGGETVMAVAQISADLVKLWVDPKSPQDVPVLVNEKGWSYYGQHDDTLFSRLGILCRQRDEAVYMDRIVVGKTFESVTAQFEPIPQPLGAFERPASSAPLTLTPTLRHSGGQLSITLPSVAQKVTVRISDIAGRTVSSHTIQHTRTLSIPTQQLAQALYVVSVKADNQGEQRFSLPIMSQ